MNLHRPDPEIILKRVLDEERKEQRGKLKIYLGAAPGVGKTYQMLSDALAERKNGFDVIIGVAESHGRDEINQMIKEFEIIPKQLINYHGKQLFDFDIDAALKRDPGLILLDEMAHTNAPGLRHTKRWQDIKELLDRGINVYTTLNVQHIESVNDDVAQILHAPVRETVPDSMIDSADTIELVDISPEDLLKRLREGKIYIAPQAELAVDHFFRKGNLIALRELALRTTAKCVGTQALMYRHDQGISTIWPMNEKILVCVGPGPESLKLIRAARRMATSLQAEWVAVFVDTPRLHSSEKTRNNAIENLRFAQQLGAQTRVLSGFDIVKEVMGFSREQNVTLIMIWKYIRTRYRDLFFRNLADEMMRYSGEIDVYIMTGSAAKARTREIPSVKPPTSWRTYAIALALIALATIINAVLYPYLASVNLIMVYLLAIVIIALFGEVGPSIMASIVSVMLYGFYFTPPFYTLAFSDIAYIFPLIIMLIVAQIISHLTIITRRHTEIARLWEQQTSALYKLSLQLASTRGEDKLLDLGLNFIAETFDSDVKGLLSENNHLVIHAGNKSEIPLDEKEQSIAQWVYDLGQVAGRGTDTLPFADVLYLPLIGSHGSLGVLQIRPRQSKSLLTPEQMHLLEACANQISVAIEVDRTQEPAKQSAQTRHKNYISYNLLQSIAHNLRTPLSSIMVSANNQIELANELTPSKTKQLGKKIYFETEQLSRLINNFLQITYLESKALTLKKQRHSLPETIQTVIELSRIKLKKRRVEIQISKDLPEVFFDKMLLQDVFNNLIDNVVKFTPSQTPIIISARLSLNGEEVIVSINDSGPGIMADEVNKLFEKFYRGRLLTTERGLGLGLAICQRIIKAHGGKIWAENRPKGGAVFRFTLPLV